MYSGFTTDPLSDRSMQGVFILCGIITGRCFLSLISARVPSLNKVRARQFRDLARPHLPDVPRRRPHLLVVAVAPALLRSLGPELVSI